MKKASSEAFASDEAKKLVRSIRSDFSRHIACDFHADADFAGLGGGPGKFRHIFLRCSFARGHCPARDTPRCPRFSFLAFIPKAKIGRFPGSSTAPKWENFLKKI